ncbi:hypothetical protein NP233_g5574 [Leucocoprinus birnbaumii]|uniref:Uncharacterized protein n=1 Tax=Leucocoprinus birnbaumii TaxID=56174 RepID=A0AAD5YQT7_9AGAR|nr:hypothetical protein NP233_g5574 [Leucocoprinus birnbaumii]
MQGSSRNLPKPMDINEENGGTSPEEESPLPSPTACVSPLSNEGRARTTIQNMSKSLVNNYAQGLLAKLTSTTPVPPSSPFPSPSKTADKSSKKERKRTPASDLPHPAPSGPVSDHEGHAPPPQPEVLVSEGEGRAATATSSESVDPPQPSQGSKGTCSSQSPAPVRDAIGCFLAPSRSRPFLNLDARADATLWQTWSEQLRVPTLASNTHLQSRLRSLATSWTTVESTQAAYDLALQRYRHDVSEFAHELLQAEEFFSFNPGYWLESGLVETAASRGAVFDAARAAITSGPNTSLQDSAMGLFESHRSFVRNLATSAGIQAPALPAPMPLTWEARHGAAVLSMAPEQPSSGTQGSKGEGKQAGIVAKGSED